MNERPPPERRETLRNALRDALRHGKVTVRELSQTVRASEHDVLRDLEHLERSLAHSDEVFVVEPSRCLSCGFTFEQRSRLNRPGRCPSCKATRISQPRFEIVARG